MQARGHKIEPGASLSGANLSGLDLQAAKLKNADLFFAHLAGSDLSSADLRGADLEGANLRGADLEGADISFSDMQRADLTGANLRYADLTGANLSFANLTDADLTGAKLVDADLSYATLDGADVSKADMTGTKDWYTDYDNCYGRLSMTVAELLEKISFRMDVEVVETPENRDIIAARLDQLSADVARLAGISKEETPAKTILAAIEASNLTSEILEMVSDAVLDCADMG